MIHTLTERARKLDSPANLTGWESDSFALPFREGGNPSGGAWVQHPHAQLFLSQTDQGCFHLACNLSPFDCGCLVRDRASAAPKLVRAQERSACGYIGSDCLLDHAREIAIPGGPQFLVEIPEEAKNGVRHQPQLNEACAR